MPELPDVEVYRESLERVAGGRVLERVRLASPFLLRSVDPPLDAIAGRRVVGARRLGKRLAVEVEGDGEPLFLVLHLMIAGRLRWKRRGASDRGRNVLACFDLEHGTLVLTEASKQRRASLHVVRGEAALDEHDPGGLELFGRDAADVLPEFATRLRAENRTLKRALCDPQVVSGVGNAYSDEILHRARLSPFTRTGDLDDATVARLLDAARAVLTEWTERLRAEVGDGFPDTVTAFRPGMAVHGRYREPCPVCGAPVQRIVRASNEVNYCPGCQTEGRILADRVLSRLLKDDWPRSLDEL